MKQPKCPSIVEWIKKMWGECVCVCVCIGFPGGTSAKEPACQHRRHKRYGFDP